jgi:hypothetical protein
MSSSRVIMSGGAPWSRCVVRDRQHRRSPAYLSGATRVGNFSEQLWGYSPERRHAFTEAAHLVTRLLSRPRGQARGQGAVVQL